MARRIQLRQDTAANWTSVNPILAQGEVGYITDTNEFKIGNGADAWDDISATFTTGGGGGLNAEGVQDIVGAFVVDSSSVNFTYDDTANTLTAAVIEAGLTLTNLTGNLAQSRITNLTTDLAAKANLAGGTFTGDISVPDEVYGAGWDGSVEVPTKNAVYDKIESLILGGGYTNEDAQDAVGTILIDSNTINATYDDATPDISFDVITQMSLTSDASGLKLSGDATTPGNSKYYGTDGSGTKGFFALPAGGSGGELETVISDSTELDTLITTAIANPTINYAVALDSDVSVTAAKTIPVNVYITRFNGYKFVVTGSGALVFEGIGAVEHSPYYKFSVEAAGDVTWADNLPPMWPEWFGAIVDTFGSAGILAANALAFDCLVRASAAVQQRTLRIMPTPGRYWMPEKWVVDAPIIYESEGAQLNLTTEMRFVGKNVRGIELHNLSTKTGVNDNRTARHSKIRIAVTGQETTGNETTPDEATHLVNIAGLQATKTSGFGFSPEKGFVNTVTITIGEWTYVTSFLTSPSGTKTATAGSAANDTVTITGHGMETADSVSFASTTGALPTGLSLGVVYYVIATGTGTDANNIKLATTYQNALAGTAINLTTDGSGNHTVNYAYVLTLMKPRLMVYAVHGTTAVTRASGYNWPADGQWAGQNVVIGRSSHAMSAVSNSAMTLGTAYTGDINTTLGSFINFTATGGGSNNLTSTGHGLVTGQAIKLYNGGTLPSPLTAFTATYYYVIVVDANTFKVATTRANALANTHIPLTTDGSGTHSFQTAGYWGEAQVQGMATQTGKSARLNIFHGITSYCQADINGCLVQLFAGSGIAFDSASGLTAPGASQQNCNGSTARSNSVYACKGHGIWATGVNSNSIKGEQNLLSGNCGAGIMEAGFLGNTWDTDLTEGNGFSCIYVGAFNTNVSKFTDHYAENDQPGGVLNYSSKANEGLVGAGMDNPSGFSYMRDGKHVTSNVEVRYGGVDHRGWVAGTRVVPAVIAGIGNSHIPGTMETYGSSDEPANWTETVGDSPDYPAFQMRYDPVTGRYNRHYMDNRTEVGQLTIFATTGYKAPEGPGKLIAPNGLIIRDGGTRPTASAALRGHMWFEEGGAGVADKLQMVMKDASDAYAWEDIYTA